MPQRTVQHIVNQAGLAAACLPRDDLIVKEAADTAAATLDSAALEWLGQGSVLRLKFNLDEGAFTSYERTLEIRQLGQPAQPPIAPAEPKQPAEPQPPAEPQYQITETTSFRLSVPFWSAALNFLVRRELGRPRSGANFATFSPGATSGTANAAATRHPWWLPAQRLDARGGHVIGVLCLMSLFTGYLGTLLSQTLTYVSDSFGADKGTQGIVLSVVRVGALLSLLVALLADRRGRKFLLRIALPGAFLLTAAGAASEGIWSFAAAQTVARGLTTAVALLIGIVAAEEMPAGARAYAASVLSLSAALGAGVMVMLLPLADVDGQAWRVLFLIPLLALPALVWLLQRLPETWRFEKSLAGAGDEGAGDGAGAGDNAGTGAGAQVARAATEPHTATEPTNRVRPESRRLLLLGSALFFFLLFVTPASQFLNEFLRDERGFSGAKITAFQLFSNTPAGISLYLAGRWSDIRGRRHIAMVALLGMTAFTVLRFASDGWTMWGWSLGSSIFAAAVVPTLGVYGPELFQTSNRGRNNGTLTVIGVCGSALGVLAIGHFTEHWISFGAAFAVLSFAPLVVVALLLFAFPETARLELETLNPDDQRAAAPKPARPNIPNL